MTPEFGIVETVVCVEASKVTFPFGFLKVAGSSKSFGRNSPTTMARPELKHNISIQDSKREDKTYRKADATLSSLRLQLFPAWVSSLISTAANAALLSAG